MYNYKNILIAGLIAIALFLIIKFLVSKLIEWKLQKTIDSAISKIGGKSIIEILDYEGFLIHVPHDKNVKTIKWQEVSKAVLTDNDSTLCFYFENGKILNLNDKEFTDWRLLVNIIPNTIQTNERLVSFKKEYFSHLSCCDICGKISVKDSSCLSCCIYTYDKYYTDNSDIIATIESKDEYISKNQLYWFTAFENNGKIDFYYKDILFENCKDWKPIVTNDEVIEYNKQLNY